MSKTKHCSFYLKKKIKKAPQVSTPILHNCNTGSELIFYTFHFFLSDACDVY